VADAARATQQTPAVAPTRRTDRSRPPHDPFARELTVELVGAGPKFRSDDGSYTIWHAQPKTGAPVAVAGDLSAFTAGDRVVCRGRWKRHPRWGWTYQCFEVRPAVAHSGAGLTAWLAARLPGVGPTFADAIASWFGDQLFTVLDADPNRLAEVRTEQGRRLPKTVVEQAARSWPALAELRRVEQHLLAAGATVHLIEQLYRAYGPAVPEVLERDPYRLTELRGIGFKKADRLARALGRPLEDPGRIAAGLEHVLEQARSDGHTFLTRTQLIEQAGTVLEVDAPAEVAAAIETLHRAGRIVVEQEQALRQQRIYTRKLYETECRVARRIRGLLEPVAPLYPVPAPWTGPDAPTAAQWQAVHALSKHRLSVLTGGPGTGKSTTIAAIVELLDRHKLTAALAAPTGRAARRMSALAGGRPAHTLHRLLGFQPASGRFEHDARDPLDADVVIVDEASMLSLPLADALLDAVGPTTRLLLVGDADQLPPVGEGRVLHDLVASGELGEAHVHLAEVHRQAAKSLLVRAARRVNTGALPYASLEQAQQELGVELEQDFYLVNCSSPERVHDVVCELVSQRVPRVFGFDPRTEIMVLSPQKTGAAGIEALNRSLEWRLNPRPGAPITGQLKVGTRVAQTVNHFELDLMNGTLATISGFDRDKQEAELVVDDGRRLTVPTPELATFVPGWCSSVHRAQGSEWPCVVVALTGMQPLITRSLLYTALTRAQRLCVLVAERKGVAVAVKRDEQERRSSLLARRIAEPQLSGELF